MKTNVFEIGKEILISSKGNGKKTIYKKELFSECVTDAEKKSMRIKLRRELQKYLATFIQYEKNPNKLNELYSVWIQYAKNVYENTNIIADGNVSESNATIIKRFLNAMEQIEKKQLATKTK